MRQDTTRRYVVMKVLPGGAVERVCFRDSLKAAKATAKGHGGHTMVKAIHYRSDSDYATYFAILAEYGGPK